MKKSGSGKGPPRYDKQGHPLAYWDDHPSCRTCLHGVGILCTRHTPCNTCKKWTDDMWAEDAEIRSAHKREKRQLIRAAKEAVASLSRAPSPVADAPLESHSSVGASAHPQVSQTIVDPPTRYRDTVLRRRPRPSQPGGTNFRHTSYWLAIYWLAIYWLAIYWLPGCPLLDMARKSILPAGARIQVLLI